MAEPFTIDFTASAEADLKWFSAYARRIILAGVELHLRNQPTAGTRRLKALRANPVAAWEIRLGDYRVLYDVDESKRTVIIQLVGQKLADRLLVRGREYTRHESNRPERGESEP